MTAPADSSPPPWPLRNRWTDVFRQDAAVHLGIMASITVATFQGYLKDRIAGPLPYTLAELLFVGAFGIWFAGVALRRTPIRGPGLVPAAVLVVIAVPVLYLIHPGTPLTVEVAGIRAWAAFPVACLMALTVIRTAGQARAYVGLVLLLGGVTAVYGIRQYWVGPEAALGIGELAAIRHGTSVFYGAGSQSDFRAFSTFTFPAPFASFMVFAALLAAGVAVGRHTTRRQRVGAALLIPLFVAGIAVSGTRAAVIVFLLGGLILAWYRGFALRILALIPLLAGAAYLGWILTAGRVLGRWQSLLLEEGLVWNRVYAPIVIAGRALAEHPFGLGLGRSGVGVPFTIFRSSPSGFFVGSDGDIGRAAVEMGVFGLLVLAVIAVALLPTAARAARDLAATHADDLALGIGAIIVSTAVLLLIGSPLSSVPHATIWWFLLGALFKLWMLQDVESRDHGGG